MKEQQHRSEQQSRVIGNPESRQQLPLRDLIQAHFKNGRKASPTIPSSPIQRLVADQISNKLYVSQSWLDEKYEGQAGKTNKSLLDPVGAETFGFKASYKKSEEEPEVDFFSRFKDSWGINSSYTVEKVNRKRLLATLFPGERKDWGSRGGMAQVGSGIQSLCFAKPYAL